MMLFGEVIDIRKWFALENVFNGLVELYVEQHIFFE